MKYAWLFLLLVACTSPKVPLLAEQQVDTDALLQAISIVDDNTVWLSGHKATFVRTTNGGKSWDIFQHPTGDTLQFRDIYAFDANRVVLMSAGSGALSRMFLVENGSKWTETFVMQDSLGFLDCIDFWDHQRGIAYGDAIDRWPYILLTDDGGMTWTRADSTSMPRAGIGEGGFAASGTCVKTGPNGLAWIATGAGGNARILKTGDYGKTWRTYYSPMIQGEAAGHTSIDFIDEQTGFATGGDLAISDNYSANCIFTTDGGANWSLAAQPITRGAFYGGSMAQIDDQVLTLACGPKGMDYSLDKGQSWSRLDSANYWAVEMTSSGIGWAAGKGGRVVKVVIQ